MADRLLTFFVRHGSTASNHARVFRGASNPPLDEKGAADAANLKEYFRHTDLGEAYTSDKLRTQQTMNTILEPHDTEAIVTKDLNALDVGYLSGKPKAAHQDEINYYISHPDEKIPEGESLNGFRSRVQPIIRHVVKRGFETGVPSIAAVHSSIIHEVGNMFHGDHFASLVKPGGVVGVYAGEKGIYAKPLVKPLKKPEGYGS